MQLTTVYLTRRVASFALPMLGAGLLLVAVALGLSAPGAAAHPGAPSDFTAFPISTATGNQQTVAVGAQNVIWQDDRNYALNSWDLYSVDRSTYQEAALIATPLPQQNPATSGDWVVYRQGTNVETQFTLNGISISTHQVITIAEGAANPINPAISGNYVIWQDTRNYPTTGYDIYGYNLTTSQEFTVCTHLGNQFVPRVSGNVVVWTDLRNYGTTGKDIYGYDLSTQQEFPIAVEGGDQDAPDIAGNYVVWADYRANASDPDIYGYNLTTHQEFPIAIVPGSIQNYPRIDGNWVVWQDGRNGISPIGVYGYYLPTGQTYPIWTTTDTRSPDVFNDLVVWEDYRNGTDSDLYGALLPDPPPPLTDTPTPVPSNTPVPPSATVTRTPGAPSATPAAPTPSTTRTPPAATATPCTISFSDVHPTDYFYTPVLYLACRGVISGYSDGTFRPFANTTRAQQVKIVVLGFQKPIRTPAAGDYTFADVPTTFPFFAVIETAAADGMLSGYACGGVGEPCDAQHRPYFRPYNNVTRGQLSKIVVLAAGWPLQNPPAPGTFEDVLPGSAFYQFVETAACQGIVSGYACGGAGEPCDPQQRPYFRQFNNATRGQIAKIVYGAVTGSGSCAPAGP